MEKVFNVEINDKNEFVYIVKISGELRRGTQLSGPDWSLQLNGAKDAAEKSNKKLVFDLSELRYWDTGGMSDIIGVIVNVNASNKALSKKAALIKPKLEHLLKLSNLLSHARRKFPNLLIAEEDLPILSNESELQEFIEG